MKISKKWFWTLGIAAGLIFIISVFTYLLNSESMRRYAERKMNQQLKDYTVRIGSAHFNPVAFSLLLKNVVLTQNANPNPPIANIKSMGASLHWSELLRLHVVAEFHIDHPKVFMNLAHFRNEERSPVPLKDKGWQEAVQSIYPIKINHLRVSDGDITYVDQGPYKPLQASKVDLVASNIRNIESPENVLPSSVHLKGAIFDKGTLTLDGRADFLCRGLSCPAPTR